MTDMKIYDKYGTLSKRFKKLLENEHFEIGTKIRDALVNSVKYIESSVEKSPLTIL